jgi:cobalt/nickel transport protein
MENKKKKLLALLIAAAIVIVLIPLLTMHGAEFGGSDDAGSVMVEQIHGEYEPWFTPVLEVLIGGELPSEMESLFFCVQTGIGVGILAFFMGRLYERKKFDKEDEEV